MPLRPLVAAKPNKAENIIRIGSTVEYEQHGAPILAVVVAERKNKWALVNEHGGELELAVNRLYLLPQKPLDASTSADEKLQYLSKLSSEAQARCEEFNLEEIWETLQGEVKETSVQEIVEMSFDKPNAMDTLVVRRVLLTDAVFFKRRKTGFEPRTPEVVDELKRRLAVEREKRLKRERFVNACLARLKDSTAALPDELGALEQIAAHGKSAPEAGEWRDAIDEIISTARLPISGKIEDKAFEILVALNHFTPDTNIMPIRLNRPIEFSESSLQHAEELNSHNDVSLENDRIDLRELQLITIDGSESRDFDDALSIEKIPEGYRIGVHISDVASVIQPGSPLDAEAFRRGTSVYLPDQTIPMFPKSASEGLLSLIEGCERKCISFFVETNSSFEFGRRSVQRSLVRISKRFTYEMADAVLCEDCDYPEGSVEESLMLLWSAAAQSEGDRIARDALQLNRREMNPIVDEDGTVRLEEGTDDQPARKLVSEMMILANETAALFAAEHSIPLIFRGQEAPEVDVEEFVKEIPEGPAREFHKRSVLKRSTISCSPLPHFGLGVRAYVHATSPIRRAVDLINHRQLSGFLTKGEIPYSEEQITLLLSEIEPGLDEAFQMQRSRNRYWLLKYLQQEKISTIKAVLIKVDGPRPLAEIDILFSLQPFHPIEKYSDSGAKYLGKELLLRLDAVDPRKEYLVLREIEHENSSA